MGLTAIQYSLVAIMMMMHVRFEHAIAMSDVILLQVEQNVIPCLEWLH